MTADEYDPTYVNLPEDIRWLAGQVAIGVSLARQTAFPKVTAVCLSEEVVRRYRDQMPEPYDAALFMWGLPVEADPTLERLEYRLKVSHR